MSGWGVQLLGYQATKGMLESLRFEFGKDVVYVVGPTVEYAVYHELGTAKMQARPFARPAAERAQASIGKYVGKYAEEMEEDSIVKAVAVGVQEEMVKIVTRKGIVETGQLRNSISIAKVS